MGGCRECPVVGHSRFLNHSTEHSSAFVAETPIIILQHRRHQNVENYGLLFDSLPAGKDHITDDIQHPRFRIGNPF